MPLDNHRDNPGEDNRGAAQSTAPAGARRRFVTRRNAVIATIGLVCAAIALAFVALVVYRLGYVDRYIAGQIKDTLAKYGIPRPPPKSSVGRGRWNRSATRAAMFRPLRYWSVKTV